jgi:hypothetical protein
MRRRREEAQVSAARATDATEIWRVVDALMERRCPAIPGATRSVGTIRINAADKKRLASSFYDPYDPFPFRRGRYLRGHLLVLDESVPSVFGDAP